MLRLKFLYLMGGAGAVGAASMVGFTQEARAAAGETIGVPPNPLHGIIAVTVEVNPMKNVLRVELYVDGAPLGVDATSPFAFVWDTTTVTDGSHTLRADSVYRNRTHSGSTVVVVNNATGTVTIFPSITLYPSEVMP
jgi:thermitase